MEDSDTLYGCVILSEWPAVNIYGMKFDGENGPMKGNSKMDRGCLLAEFYLQIKQMGKKTEVTERLYPFYVATSHFESLDRTDSVINRKFQCEDVFERLLKDEPNAVVLGDFSFDNDAEYKNNIRRHNYVDIIMEKFDALIG